MSKSARGSLVRSVTNSTPHRPGELPTLPAVSEAEHPDRARPQRPVSVEDVRQLMGASTPHFALQIRNRIARLVEPLEPADPARLLGEREIARLEALGYSGEVRGHPGEEGLPPLPSVTGAPDATPSANLHG